MRVETLGFDQCLALKSEAAHSTVLRSVVQDGLRGSRGRGKDENLAIGEDTVYIEKEQLDFLGAAFGRESVGHWRDSSILSPQLLALGLTHVAV